MQDNYVATDYITALHTAAVVTNHRFHGSKLLLGHPTQAGLLALVSRYQIPSLFSEQVRPIRLDIYIGWYTSSAHPIPPPNTKLTKNQPLT